METAWRANLGCVFARAVHGLDRVTTSGRGLLCTAADVQIHSVTLCGVERDSTGERD